jgi:transcriptional regulator with XRE-family HTH domain
MRTRLGLSQAQCAAARGIAVETFRTWVAGRRPAPEAVIERARKLKARRPASERLSLDVEVQLDCHKDVDWHVSDMAGCKSPLPNGRDRFLVEPAWIE